MFIPDLSRYRRAQSFFMSSITRLSSLLGAANDASHAWSLP